MFEQFSISHHIQKHILTILMYQEVARFSELRPPKTDTNLFSYHLKSLIKSKMVTKQDNGYVLSAQGLSYVDRVSTENRVIRMQPKIITMLLIQNSEGDVLLQMRTKQPFINTWTLPYGKLHIDDASIEAAAQREAYEKLGLVEQPLRHAGICYIRVKNNEEIISTTTVHVCVFNRDDIEQTETVQWVRPHKLRQYRLAPAVEEIVARGFFQDPFFFEEYEIEWQ